MTTALDAATIATAHADARHTPWPRRALGARGIAELDEGDYLLAANDAGLTGAALVAYLQRAAKRHRDSVARSKAEAARHYNSGGSDAPRGRLRRLVAGMRADNVRTAENLERLAAELPAMGEARIELVNAPMGGGYQVASGTPGRMVRVHTRAWSRDYAELVRDELRRAARKMVPPIAGGSPEADHLRELAAGHARDAYHLADLTRQRAREFAREGNLPASVVERQEAERIEALAVSFDATFGERLAEASAAQVRAGLHGAAADTDRELVAWTKRHAAALGSLITERRKPIDLAGRPYVEVIGGELDRRHAATLAYLDGSETPEQAEARHEEHAAHGRIVEEEHEAREREGDAHELDPEPMSLEALAAELRAVRRVRELLRPHLLAGGTAAQAVSAEEERIERELLRAMPPVVTEAAWTDGDANRARELRELSRDRELTATERAELSEIRHREIAEAARRRRAQVRP